MQKFKNRFVHKYFKNNVDAEKFIEIIATKADDKNDIIKSIKKEYSNIGSNSECFIFDFIDWIKENKEEIYKLRDNSLIINQKSFDHVTINNIGIQVNNYKE